MAIRTSNPARQRRSPRRIPNRVKFARVVLLLWAIPITALFGVACAVLLDLTQVLLWRGVLEVTEPRNTAMSVMGHGGYWLRHRAWACSTGYWNSPKSVIALCQAAWFKTPSAFMIVLAMVYALCGAWIFSLILRYRARRVGLHGFVERPDIRWAPSVQEMARILGRAFLCQAVIVVCIAVAVALALELSFSVIDLASTQPDTFGLRLGSWQQTFVVNYSRMSHEVPRMQLWIASVLGLLYSLVVCDRLAHSAVMAEYRCTARHCKRCGYPFDVVRQICPECGPFVPSARDLAMERVLKRSIRPPSRSLLKIAVVILGGAGCALAIQHGFHWIRVTQSPERPSPPTTGHQLGLSQSKMWRDFDYLAQLQLNTEYALYIDNASVLMTISSPDNRSIRVAWSVDGGPLQNAEFPAYDPTVPPGDLQTQWARIPAVFINNNALHFSIGDYIVFDQGPRRVDVRIFAESVSIDVANTTP